MFIAPTLEKVAEQVLDAVPFDHNGRTLWRVPHTIENVTALRRAGLDVDSPILHYYDWLGGEPFKPVQTNTAAMLVQERRAFVFNRPGTGKTRSAIYAFDYLRKEGIVRKMLVVGVLSTLSRAWLREFLMVAPQYKTVLLHHRNKKKRMQALAQDHDVAVINYDGLKVLGSEIVGQYDVIVADEAAAVRNAKTERWKALHRVITRARYAWLMTGTPRPKAPTDLHGLLKMLYPNHPMSRSFVRFRDRTMYKVSEFNWVEKPEADALMAEWVSPQVQYSLEDVMDLPPRIESDVQCSLSPQQRQVFDVLQKTSTDLANKITAVNAGVLAIKLLQVCSGVVFNSKKEPVVLDDGRLEDVKDIVEENDRPSIIFVPFVAAAERIYQHLKDSKTVEPYLIHGGVPKSARDPIFARFQDSTTTSSGKGLPQVLVAQPNAMAHGLTLTAANLIIWYAPISDYEIYEQANARIDRPGQTSKTRVLHMYATSQERAAYNSLKRKEKQQKTFLNMLANATEMW